jgi:RHS repeat-associated protein
MLGDRTMSAKPYNGQLHRKLVTTPIHGQRIAREKQPFSICSRYNLDMVALSQEFEVSGEYAQRFFASHHTYKSGSTRCSKSSIRRGLRRRIYDECDQLESCSKDPIDFQGSKWNLYRYVGNAPLHRIDPSGLAIIRVEFNAFISTRHDPDGDGWIAEPWSPMSIGFYFFSTDKRLAGVPGSLRIHYAVSIDSCAIGKSPPSRGGDTGVSHRGILGASGLVFPFASKKAPLSVVDGVTTGKCKGGWSGRLEASYPFGPPVLTPAISMGGTIDFTAGADTVTIDYDLYHDHFPDYEVLIFVNGVLVWTDPDYSRVHTPVWLGWWRTKYQVGSTTVSVPTQKCCGGTCR